MSKSSQFSKDSEESQKFLNPQHNRLEQLAAQLGTALEKPDGPRKLNSVPDAKAPHRHQEAIRAQPRQQVTDSMALTAPDQEPRKVGRPLGGKKPKVEKTFAIDDDIHRRLVRISNMEGLRLDKKLSVSGIMQYLLEYGLSHVEDEKVLPGPDGYGLIIEQGEQL